MIKRLRMRRGPCDKAIASWKADQVQLSDYLQECAKWTKQSTGKGTSPPSIGNERGRRWGNGA